ncbi:MAG: hypothetical protein WBC92_08005, partial [Terracidiphilus sp.]
MGRLPQPSLQKLWYFFFLVILVISVSAPPLAAQSRTVATPLATLTLSQQSGDLIGLHWKNPALDVIAEPRLGENFRILLPQKGYEANYFNSR